jgi:hypothetical protein
MRGVRPPRRLILGVSDLVQVVTDIENERPVGEQTLKRNGASSGQGQPCRATSAHEQASPSWLMVFETLPRSVCCTRGQQKPHSIAAAVVGYDVGGVVGA